MSATDKQRVVMTVTTTLFCRVPHCDKSIVITAPSSRESALHDCALDYGWLASYDGDWCPSHWD